MKNKKTIILSVIGIIIIGAVGITIKTEHDRNALHAASVHAASPPEDQALMHEEYPDVSRDNRFIRQSFDQIMDRFKNDSGIIFLGFKECPWCQRMVPMINEAAKEEDVAIYYLDIRVLREEEPALYRELIDYLSFYLQKDSDGNPHILTPDISFVKKGRIIWRYKMDVVTEQERKPDIYWTDERIKQTTDDLHAQMKKLKEG